MAIYTNEKLIKREYKKIFQEEEMIISCNEKISDILGNHRDKDNEFCKKMIEFEHTKLVRQALNDILEIKKNLYYTTGIIL